MTHNILVPLDGSASSRRIFPEIQKFFTPENANIRLLRVAAPPGAVAAGSVPGPIMFGGGYLGPEVEANIERGLHEATPSDDEWQELKKQLRNELARDAKTLQGAGFQVALSVTFGNPDDEIINAARDGIDLIAMATHGRTGLGRVLAGSVAEQVLRRSQTPMLLIRLSEEEEDTSTA